MKEIRVENALVGKYRFTKGGFLYEYKLKRKLVTMFLPLFPVPGLPQVTIVEA